MGTNNMRERFEVWAAKNYVVPPGIGHLFVRAEIGDGYRLSSINHAWHGWKASRDAVAVELPMFDDYPASMERDMRESLRSAIEAQGLKVAP